MLFRTRRNFRFLWVFGIVVFVISCIFVWGIFVLQQSPREDVVFGVSFSQKYAEELGINWKDAYIATLDDLGVRNLRLAAYWDILEPQRGMYDFRDLDFQIEEAAKRDARVVLSIGRRLPRWPECHVPYWVLDLSERKTQQELLSLMSVVVDRYRDNPTVVAWQVENEPFLEVFGKCPPPDVDFFESEIDLVRGLDPSRPIMVTESGELSSWLRASQYADIVGVSMYRVTWNQIFGYFYYPLPPFFYTQKSIPIRSLGKGIVVSELQAEPWPSDPIVTIPIREQYKSMDLERFLDNIEYAKRVGFDEVYLWGVEWWYWLDSHGKSELWEAARDVFSNS